MQTIEEYKAYAKQLEADVGKWHHAYDALMVERNDLAKEVMHLEGEIFKDPKQPRDAEIDTLTTALKTCSEELEELRKHEVQWELDKARIKELETEKSIASQMCADMALKIAAKKGTNRGPIQCVFVPNNDCHAVATDGTILACLDLNYYGEFTKNECLEELAFYADMQVINYLNGRALITAEKKEEFIFNCGKGLDTPDHEELKDTMLHYPEWKKNLPPLDAIKNVSETGAVFRPGEIGILDSVADAFDVLPLGTETIADRLYGADREGAHFSILSGLMLVANPLKSVDISVVPSKKTIQSFLAISNQEEE